MDEQTNEVDLESRVYRNHFTIVVQSMVSILIMLGIMGLVGSASSGGVFLGNPALWIVAIVGIVYIFISIRIWMKTTFSFGRGTPAQRRQQSPAAEPHPEGAGNR